MSFPSLLIHTADVIRSVDTPDGKGGFTTATVTAMRRVPCRFNAMSAKTMALIADKLKVLAGFTVYMKGGVDIREGDVLLKNDDSRKFDVKLRENVDELGRMLKLTVSERDRALR